MQMIRLSVLAVLVALCLLGCSRKDTIFQDNLGNSIQLSNLQSKWLIVTFWAPWCSTCMQEIPEMNSFYQHNRDKLIMVGVNVDPSQNESLETTLKNLDIQFPVLTSDPSSAWHLGDIYAVPMTFIMNPQGKIMKTITGGISEEDLTSLVKYLQSSTA